jgi:hypothetical protein
MYPINSLCEICHNVTNPEKAHHIKMSGATVKSLNCVMFLEKIDVKKNRVIPNPLQNNTFQVATTLMTRYDTIGFLNRVMVKRLIGGLFLSL